MSRRKGTNDLALALLSSLVRRPGLASHSELLVRTLGSLVSGSKADPDALVGRLVSNMLSRLVAEEDYSSPSTPNLTKSGPDQAAVETEAQVESIPAQELPVPDYLTRGSKTFPVPSDWPRHKT